jgi:hypothetical protein
MIKNILDKINSHDKVNKMSTSFTLQWTTRLENHKFRQTEATNVKTQIIFKMYLILNNILAL